MSSLELSSCPEARPRLGEDTSLLLTLRCSHSRSHPALTAGAAASPTKRQDACAAQCNFEQEFCTFREAPACTKVCNVSRNCPHMRGKGGVWRGLRGLSDVGSAGAAFPPTGVHARPCAGPSSSHVAPGTGAKEIGHLPARALTPYSRSVLTAGRDLQRLGSMSQLLRRGGRCQG